MVELRQWSVSGVDEAYIFTTAETGYDAAFGIARATYGIEARGVVDEGTFAQNLYTREDERERERRRVA
jgi:hypothetical protein